MSEKIEQLDRAVTDLINAPFAGKARAGAVAIRAARQVLADHERRLAEIEGRGKR